MTLPKKLRTVLLLVWFFFITAVANAGSGYQTNLEQNTAAAIDLEFLLSDYQVIHVVEDRQNFSRIEFDGGVNLIRKGFAELPFLHAAVQLPAEENYSVELIDAHYVDYDLDAPLLPSKGTIYRHEDPESIPYAIDPASVTDQWYPESVATVSDPFIFRDLRGANVYVYPFQYNARQMRLRVYEQVVVRLRPNVSPTINGISSGAAAVSQVAAEMHGIYRDLFINYPSAAVKAADIGEVGDMLVIYTSRDADAIQPYLAWKRQKGFKVATQQVPAGTHVKGTIQNAYNANSNLLYVQLVGDWADIKSDKISSGNAPTDPMLGCVAGNDNFPDLIIGRFSANTAGHVTTQINKAIAYEKNPDKSGSWYAIGLGIASNEGAGAGDDGESDIQHMDVIKQNKLLPYTYTDVKEVYGTGSATTVGNYVDNGLSLINYAGHGSNTSWGTSGFSNSDVAALSNGSKLPFIISVACVNGAFHKAGDCFAEAWLRKENGGAVATLMSTINQPWQPPMRGQDYMNDLLIGGYDYNANPGSGTSTTQGRTTLGSIVFNALVLMYAESSQSADLETIQTWTIFGDASLQVRTDWPEAIDISNQTVVAGQPFGTTVTRGANQAVSGAMVALQQNGTVASGLTGSNGQVAFNHPFTSGTVTLVVSGANLDTRFQNVTVDGGTGNHPPQAKFTYHVDGRTVAFTDQSTDSDGSVEAWFWDFGDGGTSHQQNPTHTYAADGSYAVTLTVTDNENATGAQTRTVMVNTSLAYCDSTGQIYSDEWIARVDVGSFSNPSGAAGYSDFTAQVVNLTKGRTLPVSLTPGFSGSAYNEFWKIRIDLNQDGTFSADEELFSNSGTGTVTGSLTIPASAADGSTRMRVSMKYNAAPGACETFQYGEVEDYSVNIDAGGSWPRFTLTASTVGQGTVTLDPPGGGYAEGTQVTVTAVPASGWEFAGWSGDLTGSTNPATIFMHADKNVTASFADLGPNSCVGNCGGQAPGGCWCDGQCAFYGDCCADKVQACGP